MHFTRILSLSLNIRYKFDTFVNGWYIVRIQLKLASIVYMCILRHLFRAQEPKAPVTYCDHALSGVRRLSSVVRLSSVRLFTFSTSSPEPLDGF